MRLAMFSDVHSNLPALQAVLDDIKAQNVDHIHCLGDMVLVRCGYSRAARSDMTTSICHAAGSMRMRWSAHRCSSNFISWKMQRS